MKTDRELIEEAADRGFPMMVVAKREVDRLTRENDILRGIAAKVMPCHYCHATEIIRCPYGFPGCALADDVMAAEEVTSAAVRDLRAVVRLCLATYADTQRHPTPAEEAAVITAARAALK